MNELIFSTGSIQFSLNRCSCLDLLKFRCFKIRLKSMNLYAKLISFAVRKLIPEVKPTEMNPLIHIKLLFCFNG